MAVVMFLRQALLEQQLAVEKGKMETEKKKFQHAMDEKVTNSLDSLLEKQTQQKSIRMYSKTAFFLSGEGFTPTIKPFWSTFVTFV